MGRNAILNKIVMNKVTSDLIVLEELSKQISDLIYNNDFDQILELDTNRQLIIKNFENNQPINIAVKNKLLSLIKCNEVLLADVQSKMKNLTKSHIKFNKRLKFYSLNQ
mgnify:CR=1 FL=1|jgi:hypothetical protein|tara:strand:- start:160 stop:486 length:327 start_codon:yes stop_codon:yes gene_type:complete